MRLSSGRMRMADDFVSLRLAVSIAVSFRHNFVRGEHARDESRLVLFRTRRPKVTVRMLCIVPGSRELGPIGV